MPDEGSRLDVHGVPTLVRISGEGPPVVALYDTLHTSYGFLPLFVTLGEKYRTVGVDLPGLGGTPVPASFDFSLEAYAKFLDNVLTTLGLRDATLLLQDWGIPVGLAYLNLEGVPRSGRISRVVMLNGPLYPEAARPSFLERVLGGAPKVPSIRTTMGRADYRRAILQGYGDPRHLDESMVTEAWAFFQKGDPDVPGKLSEGRESVRRALPELRENLKRSRLPLLVIWGEEDPLYGREHPERIQDEIPEARVLVIPEAGRFPHLEATEAVAEEIRLFGAARPPGP